MCNYDISQCFSKHSQNIYNQITIKVNIVSVECFVFSKNPTPLRCIKVGFLTFFILLDKCLKFFRNSLPFS